jgi:molybdopterin molybdotransferase
VSAKAPPLPLEEAQARLLALISPLPIERVDAPSSLGRYLAEPLVARRTQPAHDLSAMDGYAVAPGDLAGPWRVIGESAAGHPCKCAVKPGQAVRISTGAFIPQGAGAVILQEDLAREGDVLRLTGEAPLPESRHIRPLGMDFAQGSQILAAGGRIGPAQMAMGVASGHHFLPVRRKPHVAIIDSGDELASDCENCPPHQIPASNGIMLAALAAQEPCEVSRFGPVADTMDALLSAFAAASDADLIVTSGGASVGDHDLVRPALEQWGAEIDFWRIAIKPGKPLLVATRERPQGMQLILGLPGNPVSSHVTAFLFMLPLLRAMAGAAHCLPRSVESILATPVNQGGARREFLRAQWDGASVTAMQLQDSGALSSLAHSNALIDRAAHAAPAQVGETVSIFLLENGAMA